MLSSRTRLLLAVGSGALFALASPPTDLYPALWLGMAGLAVALSDDARPSRLPGALRGLAFGIAVNLVALRFIPAVVTRFTDLPWAAGVLALVLLAAFEGLRWTTAALVCRWTARLGLPRPIAFALGVYAGSFVPTMLPWSAAGGVTPWPAMVQLADAIGERGVTALMALSAGLLGLAIEGAASRPRRARAGAAAAALAIPLLTLAHGAWRIRAIEARRGGAPTVRIGLVQPSIPAKLRWEPQEAPALLDKLTRLTRSAEERGAELTVWPESAYPVPLEHGATRGPFGERAIVGFGLRGPILTGLLMTSRQGSFNSAVLATGDGAILATQDKVHLLWFGESVPLADRWPWIRQTFARGVGLRAGERFEAMRWQRVRAAVLNCFEDTLPNAGREAMRAEPNLLINVTNDAWFEGSAESELHLRLAALRAVEARRDLVRAVNLGPTSFVDATGRVRARYGPQFPGSLVVDAALLDDGPSFYSRAGDRPLVWGAVLGVAGLAALRVARRLRARK